MRIKNNSKDIVYCICVFLKGEKKGICVYETTSQLDANNEFNDIIKKCNDETFFLELNLDQRTLFNKDDIHKIVIEREIR